MKKNIKRMKESVMKDRAITKGFSFGLTSGIITILGMIIGLNTATHNRLSVIAGIVTVAVADTLSDSFGIHISEEAEGDMKEWTSTIYTFLSKFSIALIFLISFIFMELFYALMFSILFGLSVICIFSYFLAKKQDKTAWKVVGEHLLFALFVIAATYITGYLVRNYVH